MYEVWSTVLGRAHPRACPWGATSLRKQETAESLGLTAGAQILSEDKERLGPEEKKREHRGRRRTGKGHRDGSQG